jgi:hypothetical protein
MHASSWLFVKGDQSIRVVRPHAATALSVAGPGPARAEYAFDGEGAVQAYQVELAEQFSAAGWILIGQDHERRSGHERRSNARGGSDRRRSPRG